MENFKEFLTSTIGNSDIIEWWMLLVAIIAVVIIICVIIGIAWTRKDKKNKSSKNAEAISNEHIATDEPVISVLPSEQSVEPVLPETVENKTNSMDDGVITLKSVNAEQQSAACDDAPMNAFATEAVAATVVPQETDANSDKFLKFDNELTESEDDMGIFKKKKNETVTQNKTDITMRSDSNVTTVTKPEAQVEQTPTVKTVVAPPNKSTTATTIKAVPIAKKIAPVKTVAAEEPKKQKVVVGTEALPKSVKKNIKLNEIKNTVVLSPNETFGKYFIIKDDRNSVKPFKFELRANNGQLLFESEPYKVKPRENSIEAFKKHVNTGEFVVDEDKFGFFRFKLYTDAGKLLGVGESYKTRQSCESSIESVKRFSLSATVVEDTTIENDSNAE